MRTQHIDINDATHTVQLMPPQGTESLPGSEPDPTAMTEHTSPEHMPFVPPRHSTLPSGAAALPLGSRSTDSSSSTDTSTEDKVVYLRTQKPVQEEKYWDTSDEEGHILISSLHVYHESIARLRAFHVAGRARAGE